MKHELAQAEAEAELSCSLETLTNVDAFQTIRITTVLLKLQLQASFCAFSQNISTPLQELGKGWMHQAGGRRVKLRGQVALLLLGC